MVQSQTNTGNVNCILVSQQLLLAAKTGEPTDSLSTVLAKLSFQELQEQLSSYEKGKAFWINVYNAYTQILLVNDADAYKHRNRFFGNKQILIAGKKLSLDFIEHRIIRHSQWKWGLGYIGILFPSKFEKQVRLHKKDYRIHFALNCGAKSCPPIAFYDPLKINEQLKVAEKSFLKNEIAFREVENKVEVSKIFSWFLGDFGGKKGIRNILIKQNIIPPGSKPSIVFKQYDWNLALKSYSDF
jgi:hypothetical protein